MPAQSDHHRTDPIRTAARGPEHGPATPVGIPVSISRTRIKLVALALLAAAAPVVDTPEWLTVALTLMCLAVPPAVAALGGADLVRELFLLPPRPIPSASTRKDDHL
ncbi:hypothetical protein [Microtetraspora malaysiensis]|uniref:hypothetical protein n=1 Tax=Microtetraspora malaysiensis TaxID=161358 RepID=UPI00082AF58C|nr:hypothetical protein [Microtetraspora malaysiensis]